MSEDGGDLDLRSLDDDELVKQMQDDLYDGLKAEVEEGVHILLERGWTPYRVLTEALVGGMTIVGIDFRDGILFVPEVLLAANAMKGGMAILRPLLVETGAPHRRRVEIEPSPTRNHERALQRDAESGNVTRVLWNLRPVQNNRRPFKSA